MSKEAETTLTCLASIGFLGFTHINYKNKIVEVDRYVRFYLGIDQNNRYITLKDLRSTYNKSDSEWIIEVLSRRWEPQTRDLVWEFRVFDRHGQERWMHVRSAVEALGPSERIQRLDSALFDITHFKRNGGRCLTSYRPDHPDPKGDLISGFGLTLRAARQLGRKDILDWIEPIATDAIISVT